MSHKIILIAVVVLQIAVHITQSKPFYKWSKLNDVETLFIDPEIKYNWFEAMRECTLRNMTLITVDTPEKNVALVELLKKKFDKHPSFWTSGHDNGGGNVFIWGSTGKPLEFNNWKANVPDNKKDTPNGIIIEATPDFEWDDNMCTTKNGIICEENRFVVGSRHEWEIKKNSIQKIFSI